LSTGPIDGVPPCPAITIGSAGFSPPHAVIEPTATEPTNPQTDIHFDNAIDFTLGNWSRGAQRERLHTEWQVPI
jgi:hypothetical protein